MSEKYAGKLVPLWDVERCTYLTVDVEFPSVPNSLGMDLSKNSCFSASAQNFFQFFFSDFIQWIPWGWNPEMQRYRQPEILWFISHFPSSVENHLFLLNILSSSHSIRRRLHSAILFKFIGNINNDSFLSVCLLAFILSASHLNHLLVFRIFHRKRNRNVRRSGINSWHTETSKWKFQYEDEFSFTSAPHLPRGENEAKYMRRRTFRA